jgi:hypothetical protein
MTASYRTRTWLFVIVALVVTLLPALAEDWSVNGKDYHNVTVGKVEPDRVHITYDGGIGTVMLSDLTPELQKRFNYDPQKAKAAAKAEEERLAQADQAEYEKAHPSQNSNGFQNTYVQVIQVLPNGILADIWSYPDDGRYIDFHAGVNAYVSTGKTIFIQCNSSGLAEDEKYMAKISRSGTFTYQDTSGASRTVQKWVAVK